MSQTEIAMIMIASIGVCTIFYIIVKDNKDFL